MESLTIKTITLLFLLANTLLTDRTWTDDKGRVLEAELVRVEGDFVIVSRSANKRRIALELCAL